MNLEWQEKERKYFDSGDFELTAKGKTTDNGVINTGKAHPCREDISRPHSSVPGNSNIQENANENPHDRKSSEFVMKDSPLHQRTDQQSKEIASSKPHEAVWHWIELSVPLL